MLFNLRHKVATTVARGDDAIFADVLPSGQSRDNTLPARAVQEIIKGSLTGPSTNRVRLTGFYIVGDLDLSFLAGTGQLALRKCIIDGNLSLQEARFTGEIDLDGTHVDQLDLRGAKIDGNFLLQNSEVKKGIRGIGLSVTGAFRLTNSHISADPDKTERMAIEVFRAKFGDVFLSGTYIRGGLYASGMTVDRNLRLLGATVTSRLKEGWKHEGSDYKGAVVLANVEIKGSLYLWTQTNPGFTANDTVNLRMSSCRQLFVSKATFTDCPFILDGLKYEGLNNISHTEMLAVLNAQKEPELSRAYVQLASYCGATGDIKTRRKTLISLENRITRALPQFFSLTRWARRLYRWSVVYGYHPALAILWLLLLLLAATAWIHSGIPVFSAKPAAGQPITSPSALDWSESVGIVIDGFLPFTSLGIKERWVATPSTAVGWLWLSGYLLFRFISWGLAGLALLSFTNVARSSRG